MTPAEIRAHCDPANDPCRAVRELVHPVAVEAADAKNIACEALERVKSLDNRVWGLVVLGIAQLIGLALMLAR
jgi:hypothetical protein